MDNPSPAAHVAPAPVPERKSGPVPVPAGQKPRRPLNPLALSKSAGVMLGLSPRDSKYLTDFLASSLNPKFPNYVCIKCGTHGLKASAVMQTNPVEIVFALKEVYPRFGALLHIARNAQLEAKHARDDTVVINGLCRRCQVELGGAVPSTLRVPYLENDDGDRLRSIVTDLCLEGKAYDAYMALKELLDA